MFHQFPPSWSRPIVSSLSMVILSLTVCTATHQTVAADEIFTVMNDGDVQTFGGDDVNTTDDRLSTAQSGGLIRNIILEFDLSSLGAGTVVNSGTLNLVKFGLQGNTGGNPVPLELYAYTGDNIVNLADYDAPGTAIGTNSVPLGIANGTAVDIVLSDIAPIQSVVDGSGLLTIRIETNSFGTLELASLENGSGFNAPELSLNVTAVPEPSGMLIVSALCCGLAGIRRRRLA